MASLNLGRGSVFLLSGAGTAGAARSRRGCWPPGPAVTPGEVALGRASSVAWGSVATPALAHPPWRWPRRARGPARLRVRPPGVAKAANESFRSPRPPPSRKCHPPVSQLAAGAERLVSWPCCVGAWSEGASAVCVKAEPPPPRQGLSDGNKCVRCTHLVRRQRVPVRSSLQSSWGQPNSLLCFLVSVLCAFFKKESVFMCFSLHS